MDKSSDGELLESIAVHMMKDEEKKKEIWGGPVQPKKHILKPVTSVQEVQQIILRAKREKKIVRVVGSEHSVSDAIYGPKDGFNLLLTKDLRKVEIQRIKKEDGKQWLYCRIGAGCYLGKDPLDPTSEIQNSACIPGGHANTWVWFPRIRRDHPTIGWRLHQHGFRRWKPAA